MTQVADQTAVRDSLTRAGPANEIGDLVRKFAVHNSDYYTRQFTRIEEATGIPWSFNWAAALLGPVWLGARSLWAQFWIFWGLEIIAAVQIGLGLWGDLGAADLARAERLRAQAAARLEEANEALAAGASNAESLSASAEAIGAAADRAQQAADAAAALAPRYLAIGIGILVIAKILEGVQANWSLERRFSRWRSDRSIPTGISPLGTLAAVAMVLFAYPLTVYRFTVAAPPAWLVNAPADSSWRAAIANGIEAALEWLATNGGGLFAAITGTITAILNGLEFALVTAPWPVVMVGIIGLAWQLAGARVAIFSTAALAYLVLLDFWEQSMATVALLGTAALLCIVIGIPLGIWCGRSKAVYTVVRPVLDFMQTMPAFVYLIPVIAFFGIGKPPGVIATLIFGMPPVVRLTALGLQGVPESVREAATAFGAGKTFLLFKVDLPLAMPSIMAGVNQTILMCLSMVVIASLIGAKGLGEDVLIALQYAAEGQGVLAGLAILFCAMVLDRIVQGRRS